MDIRLREVGAKRRLNGTSKSEQTDTQTDRKTDRRMDKSTYRKHCPVYKISQDTQKHAVRVVANSHHI